MPDLIVNSPEYWLDVLDKKLHERRPSLQNFGAYYDGDQPLLFATQKFREAFGRQFTPWADNWCGLVVDAVAERLQVEGFRLPDTTEANSQLWDIWQRNQLDADSELAHTEALIYGDSYALVAPENGTARITVESPLQVICAREKGDRRRRAAALKVWVEEDEYAYATLYLPQAVFKYRTRNKVVSGAGDVGTPGAARWDKREIRDEDWPLVNPFGVVPVIPFVNNPSMLGWGGRPEHATVMPVQDAVNKLLADMIVASEFGAFRQRWATGVEDETDADTNQKIDSYVANIARLWKTPNEDAAFGDFAQTDLENFVKAVELLVQHIASQTRTPPHYFYLSGSFPSGESIKAAETGLVKKALRKQLPWSESWEEVMRLAYIAEGKRLTKKFDGLQVIWGDPESRTESEHVDAVVKLKALNVPDEVLWEKAGFSQQEIARMREMVADQPPEQKPSAFTNGATQQVTDY